MHHPPSIWGIAKKSETLCTTGGRLLFTHSYVRSGPQFYTPLVLNGVQCASLDHLGDNPSGREAFKLSTRSVNTS